VARIVAVAADLLLGSRVEAMLGAAGHEVTLASSAPEAPLAGVDALVADLDAVNSEEIVGLDVPVLGFYSHVDVETREAAVAAGVDIVVPRSRMARELPQLVEKLLSD
jgi:hypothetical protein